jgi:hypothetical protein
MQNRMFSVLFASLFSLSSFAMPPSAPRALLESKTRIQKAPSTLSIGAEVNQGTASLGDASGAQTEALLLVSFPTEHWIFEAGAGIFYSLLSESSTGTSSSSGNLTLQSYEMTTQSEILKFSPQYRVTPQFQIGPVAEFLFGADLSFNPGIFRSSKNTAWLGGAQALYRFNLGSPSQPFHLGLGVRYLRSLDLPREQLTSLQGTLQIALPLL